MNGVRRLLFLGGDSVVSLTLELSCVVVALCLAAAPGGAQVGEANRWTCRGGSPARSGAVATEPLRGSVAVGWTFEPDGTILGEPLAFEEVLFVEVLRGRKERSLVALDRVTGRELSSWSTKSDHSLVPSVHGRKVLVRSDDNVLVGLLLERGRLKLAWSERFGSNVLDALLVGEDVVVLTTESLRCLDWSRRLLRRKPRWEHEGTYYGDLCVAHDLVHAAAVGSERTGVDSVRSFALADGSAQRSAGRVKRAWREDLQLASIGGGIIAHRPGQTVPVRALSGASTVLEMLVALPAAMNSRAAWLGLTRDGRLAYASLRAKADVVANRVSNPRLFTGIATPSVANGVAYLGSFAIDVVARDILWRVPLVPDRRVVPVRDGALFVEADGTRLVALQRQKRDVAWTLEPGAFEGVLVSRRGEVVRGEIEIVASDAGELRLTAGGDEFGVDELLVLLDAAGTPCFATGREALVRGLGLVWDEALLGDVLDLAQAAREARDPKLVRSIAQRAAELGAEDKDLARLDKGIETLLRRGKSIYADQASTVKADYEQLEARRAEEFWTANRAMQGQAPELFADELLGAVLERAPQHTGVQSAIRDALSEGAVPAERFAPKPWLDFLRVNRRTPVAFARGESGDAPDVVRVLAEQRVRWREDLVAFASEHVIVVTPERDPGRLARVVGTGELVCDILEDLCGAPREGRPRLVVLLASSKREYLEISGQDPDQAEGGLGWSAGHYDPSVGVSRLFFPGDDEFGLSVLETFVHELTHQWMDLCCSFTPEELSHERRVQRPGYWLVEGFACLLEGFQFDPVEGLWSSETLRNYRLDTYAAASRRIQLDRFEKLSQRDFHFADLGTPQPVPSSFHLGMSLRVDFRSMFYAESASACHYLYHADEGAFRGKLIELLRGYYAHEGEGTSLLDAVGLGAGPLERALVEHTRRVLGMLD